MSLYQVLALQSNATHRQVKTAYIQLAKIYHPDVIKKQQGAAATNEQWLKITKAYEILGDQAKRREYDNEQKAQTNHRSTTQIYRAQPQSSTGYNQAYTISEKQRSIHHRMHYPSPFQRATSRMKDRTVYDSEREAKEESVGISMSVISVSLMLFGLVSVITHVR